MNITARTLFFVGMGIVWTWAGGSLAFAGGCCPSSGGHDSQASHGQSAEKPATAGADRQPTPALSAVMDNYTKIQAALADDTLEGVADAARALARQLAGDAAKSLPIEQLAAQSEALMAAKDLAAARAAFKSLSGTFGKYFSAEKIQTGHYFQMYCSMAKAGWIQSDKAIKNPYYGKSMLRCGEIVGKY